MLLSVIVLHTCVKFAALTVCCSDHVQPDTLPLSPAANKVTADTGCCVDGPRSNFLLLTLFFWYASGAIIFYTKDKTESGYTCPSTLVPENTCPHDDEYLTTVQQRCRQRHAAPTLRCCMATDSVMPMVYTFAIFKQ